MDTNRNYNFDLLRFVILFILITFHYIVDLEGLELLKASLNYALPGFFVLSGYLIHQQLAVIPLTRQNIVVFYLRRGIRIVPSYLLVLTIAACFYKITYLEWSYTYLLNIRLFVSSVMGDIEAYAPRWKENGIHYWSMGIEEQFYILYPLILCWITSRNNVKAIAVLIFVCICFRVALRAEDPSHFYGALLPVSGEYILWGSLAGELHLRGYLKRFKGDFFIYVGLLLVAIPTLGTITDHAEFTQFKPPHTMTLFAILMALMVNALNRSVFPYPILKPFIYIGKISYGIYLTHVFLIAPFRELISPWVSSTVGQLLVFYLFATAIGVILWEIFESPINRYRHKFQFHKGVID